MATYAQLQHADKNAEKIDDKGTRASYMFASEMPKHVESSDVFPTLYDPDQEVVITNQKATYARPDQEGRMVQPIGSEIRILAMCRRVDAEKVADAIHRSTLLAKLPMAPLMIEPANLYQVYRRGAPLNVLDDETLGRNIIQFAFRLKHLKEAETKADVRMEERPERPAIQMPETTRDLFPQADEFRMKIAENERLRKFNALLRMSTDPKKSKKAQAIAKKHLRELREDRGALQERLSDTDPYVKKSRQKFAAVSYVFSPRYYTIDETRFLNKPALSPEDMCPEKVFTESDFDEAICVQVVRCFETHDECRKFVNNRAKHDLGFGFVEVVDMGKFLLLEHLITKAHAKTVPRSYQVDRLNEVVVDREQAAQAAQALAKERPDLVRQQVVNPDGSVQFTETHNDVTIVPVVEGQAVQDTKLLTPEEASKHEQTTSNLADQGGGGGSKSDVCNESSFTEATSEASVSTSEPSEATTSEPTEATTSEASVSTSEPSEATTTEPSVSTSEPTESTSEPSEATSEPSEATSEPSEATSESTSDPSESTSESSESTSEATSELTESISSSSLSSSSDTLVATFTE